MLGVLQPPRAFAGEFTPFFHLAAGTMLLTAGTMFAVATSRIAAVFGDHAVLVDTFVNREFFQSYAPDTERTVARVVAITIDEASGSPQAATITVETTQQGQLKSEIVSAARVDQRAISQALEDVRGRSPLSEPTDRVAARAEGAAGSVSGERPNAQQGSRPVDPASAPVLVGSAPQAARAAGSAASQPAAAIDQASNLGAGAGSEAPLRAPEVQSRAASLPAAAPASAATAAPALTAVVPRKRALRGSLRIESVSHPHRGSPGGQSDTDRARRGTRRSKLWSSRADSGPHAASSRASDGGSHHQTSDGYGRPGGIPDQHRHRATQHRAGCSHATC